VSKERIIEAVPEGVSAEAANNIAGMKKRCQYPSIAALPIKSRDRCDAPREVPRLCSTEKLVRSEKEARLGLI
jgi:hypothetical protein